MNEIGTYHRRVGRRRYSASPVAHRVMRPQRTLFQIGSQARRLASALSEWRIAEFQSTRQLPGIAADSTKHVDASVWMVLELL